MTVLVFDKNSDLERIPCSGLPVIRYSAEALHAEFGPTFRVVISAHEDHHTPGGREQSFLYCLCRREESASANYFRSSR